MDNGQVLSAPPIRFFYTHFHNAIKKELESLAKWVQELDSPAQAGADLYPELLELRERYRFVEQVHKYHSSVEDEVVYPALDGKVKNVTIAYSVEHQEEELLLEQLAQLISAAMYKTGAERTDTIRGLICKVEEIHRTLKQHLAKEEEQLLPLLMQHFTFPEQAELVAQFLYCIPLAMVERVLAWIKPSVPKAEQVQLLQHIQSVVPDTLLQQLLTSWLQPCSPANSGSSCGAIGTAGSAPAACTGTICRMGTARSCEELQPIEEPECCAHVRVGTSTMCPHVSASHAQVHTACTAQGVTTCCHSSHAVATVTATPFITAAQSPPATDGGSSTCTPAPADALAAAPALPVNGPAAALCGANPIRAPIKEIIHIHRTICTALEDFAREARTLQARSDVTALQLASLVERHRFLRSVCMFHTISEEEVMYPEVRRLVVSEPGLDAPHGFGDACVHDTCSTCKAEHDTEVSALENLGRLLADVRAFARRGRKEVATMLARLSKAAEQVHGSISEHMAREEAEVFPLLERHLCATQQRAMVWRTLRAMPLRLLERVMPCVTATMSAGDTQQLLANMRLGAPAHDSTLVELLTRWAEGPRGQGLQLQHCLAGGAVGGERAGMAPGLLAVGDGISTLQGNGCVGSAAGVEVESHGGSVLLPLGAGEGAAVAVEPAPKRQRLSEPCSSGQVTQSGALCGGAGQLRAVLAQGAVGVAQSRGGGVEAVLLPAGMLSRQQSTSSDLDPCNTAGGYQGVEEMCCDGGAVLGGPTAANASMEESTTCSALGAGTAALGAGGVAGTSPSTCGCPGGAAHVLERGSSPAGTGTVTGAVVRAGPSPTPSVAAAASAGKGSEGGNSDGDGSGEARSQFNPIDHIFQFHQALRQELRQLEAEALRLEAAVMDELSSAGGNGAGGGARPGSRLGPSCLSGGLSSGAEAPAAAGGPERAGAAAAASAGVAAAAAGEVEEHTAVRPFGCVTGTGTPRATASAGVPDFLRSPFGCSGTGLARTCSPAVGGSSGGGPLAAGCRLPWRVAAALQALEGRFHFMWGIYRAHSRSEDEIVFPALESKQALRNVSHAYTLDHQQEEQLFVDLEAVVDVLRKCGSVGEAREHVLAVRRMCAAVRASLETHIRAEEAELWPLFTEHFSTEEQQYLVGVIIGRTGAQVLQALLPWITESFSVEEQAAMMGSLRQATKNTMFDQWLEAVTVQPHAPPGAALVTAGARTSSGGCAGAAPGSCLGTGQDALDPEVARYLAPAPGPAAKTGTTVGASGGPSPSPFATAAAAAAYGTAAAGGVFGGACFGSGAHGGAAVAGRSTGAEIYGAGSGPGSATPVENATFRPGWEDIFRMNQKQLEAAVMRVSADPNLEPGRKAYLIQNIMVSRYIVAQQRRMQGKEEGGEGVGTGGSTGSGGSLGCCEVGAGGGVGAAVACGHMGSRVCGGAHVPCSYHDAAKQVLGCKHYKRRAQLVAPCCNKVFPCRLCHDEAVPHRMDRYAVSEMVCMACGTRGPVGDKCASCHARPARYYCSICHLFDDEPGRDIYHCPFCNVCRRGRGLGIDFFHCMTCNSCMSLSVFKTHKCREKAMEANCPVCSEYLFDSADPIKELPCGHLLHSRCFAEYTRYNYTCPLCSKSVGDMSVYFQMLDSLLASERLPPEYAGRMQQVLCNDCSKSGFARFHFAYHACPHCRSYNTRVV